MLTILGPPGCMASTITAAIDALTMIRVTNILLILEVANNVLMWNGSAFSIEIVLRAMWVRVVAKVFSTAQTLVLPVAALRGILVDCLVNALMHDVVRVVRVPESLAGGASCST